ncbi:formyltetrahydrofolate deformylase [Conexibacter sp. S30A1]|uniref:formyltetrahydrofolate deformylase n=1 Tax=Conexibacter sp. S30A1 TaxID=2937800 RepID=UPI00200C0471|nr:formyltetrahydrofolate deformylase [Conexibacter sp. S30A1]
MSRSNVARLLVSCRDREGIVASLSGALADVGANIITSDQFSSDPYGGSFSLRMEFYVPNPDERLAQLEQRLAELGSKLELDYRLVDARRRKRVALFVSRYDHCLLDLLWRWRRGELGMDVIAVVSNHPDLRDEVARFGVPYHHIPVNKETKSDAERAQIDLLCGEAELIVLARYMQVLSDDFLRRIGCPVINIHHSFLPAFAGAGPYLRAHHRGVKLIGATAHYATEDLDEGPIIEQDVIRVTHREGPGELERIGADVERTVLARAVNWHLDDRVLLQGHRTIVF